LLFGKNNCIEILFELCHILSSSKFYSKLVSRAVIHLVLIKVKRRCNKTTLIQKIMLAFLSYSFEQL
jgi:hypothetical protein